MTTDVIADFLTRIRNGIMVKKKIVEVPASKMKLALTQVLLDKGYISKYKLVEDGKQGVIKIALKYDKISKRSAITGLTRVSSPGLRHYVGVGEMPKVLNGLGIAILSTSRGVMSDKEARSLNVGGEVLCYVY